MARASAKTASFAAASSTVIPPKETLPVTTKLWPELSVGFGAGASEGSGAGADDGVADGHSEGGDDGSDVGPSVGSTDGRELGSGTGAALGPGDGTAVVGGDVGAGEYDTWKVKESVMDASSAHDSVNVYELICASPGVTTWYSPSLSSVNVSMTLPENGRTTDATTLVHALGSPRYSQSV